MLIAINLITPTNKQIKSNNKNVSLLLCASKVIDEAERRIQMSNRHEV